jgi:DNA-binding response OmpR family regulator
VIYAIPTSETALPGGRPRRVKTRQKSNGTILLVPSCASQRDTVRVFALLHGWHVISVSDVNSALHVERRAKVNFILYDGGVPPSARCHGVPTLLGTRPSVLVLLSFTTGERLRLKLVTLGAYEVIRKPMVLQTLAWVARGHGALPDAQARAQPFAAKFSGVGWT